MSVDAPDNLPLLAAVGEVRQVLEDEPGRNDDADQGKEARDDPADVMCWQKRRKATVSQRSSSGKIK